MNLTTLVDVGIGLCVVYLGASLWVSVLNEYIAQLLQLRAKQLKADLQELIDAPKIRETLAMSPALAVFFGDQALGRSYVDPKVLAQQLIGGLRTAATAVQTVDDIISTIDKLPDSKLKQQLSALARTSTNDVTTLVNNVGVWLDQSLTMMGEIYKKRSQNIAFGLGLLLAVALNLDTTAMARQLYQDRETREAMAAFGSDIVQGSSKEVLDKCAKLKPAELQAAADCATVRNLLDGLRQRDQAFGKLPIGWPVADVSGADFVTMPVGWLLTALAASLGSSFWFDLLGRLVNLRHGMRKPEAAAAPDKPAAG